MDKEKFEKKKSLLVQNGLSFVKGLKDTFDAILKYDWYENWEYPNEFRKINGTKLEPVEIRILFDKIRALATELVKYPNKLESLWEKGLK